MSYLLGFDPGGQANFGWCVAKDADALPLTITDTGIADHASGAVAAAFNAVPLDKRVVAIGIDSPMFWVSGGDREVDQTIRDHMLHLGAHNVHGTVQSVNSLRGACVVQGILTAILSRARVPNLPVSESHPKAVLWLMGVATPANPPAAINLLDLPQFFDLPQQLHPTDHERDSAIACLSAWAMIHRPDGWEDILPIENNPYLPVPHPLGYWIPQQ